LVIEITTITFHRLGPSTEASRIASRIAGKASCTSAMRMSTLSTHPPKCPARRPRSTPKTPATSSVETPTVSETRAPIIIWANRSWPTWSVPNTAKDPLASVVPGGLSRRSTSVRKGSKP